VKTLAILAIFGMTFLIQACGEEESDTENVDNLQDGEWFGKCIEDSEDENALRLVLQDDDDDDDDDDGGLVEPGGYEIEGIKFEEKTFSRVGRLSNEADCSSVNLDIVMNGDYVAGEDAASESPLETATPIDITVKELFVIPRSQVGVDFLNYKVEQGGVVYFDMCTPVAVLDQRIEYSDCPGFQGDDDDDDDDAGDDDDDDGSDGGEEGGGNGGPQVGQVWYNIFKATDDLLLFGKDDDVNDGSTKDKRPTTLDANGLTKG
jgi:hypothetical protein